MFLEWMKLAHSGLYFETIHNVSASQLEVLVTWRFPSWEMPKKQDPKWVKCIHFNMNIGSNNTCLLNVFLFYPSYWDVKILLLDTLILHYKFLINKFK